MTWDGGNPSAPCSGWRREFALGVVDLILPDDSLHLLH
jgi:hypothetical protein